MEGWITAMSLNNPLNHCFEHTGAAWYFSLTPWGQDVMTTILQMFRNIYTFFNKKIWILIKISLKIFPTVKLKIFRYWFGKWNGTDQPPSHCLNQWWSSLLKHICVTRPQWVNSLEPNRAIRHCRTWWALVQIMVYCLIHTKPLPEPIRTCCQLNLQKQNSVEF